MAAQPFSYYGGKQKLVSKIIPYIPKHKVYVEPFCGGASLFWAKPDYCTGNNTYYREVLNDTDKRLVNFFRVLQDEELSPRLINRLKNTLYSRDEYAKAKIVLQNYECFSDIEVAWAWYIQTNWSFANGVFKGWAFVKIGTNSPITELNRINKEFYIRIKSAYIENLDAIKCIETWDSEDTFFYMDPPYVDTDQGHYKGYTESDFQNLIETLRNIKGSFILSHYYRDDLPIEWKRIDFETNARSACGKNGKGKGGRIDSIWIVDKTKKEDQLEFAV